MIANIFGSGDIHTQETIETEFEMVSDLKWYTKVVDTGWDKVWLFGEIAGKFHYINQSSSPEFQERTKEVNRGRGKGRV